MIGKLSGRIGYVADDHALIETPSGVGYIVYCAPRTLASLPAAGRAAALFTEMVVREDLMQLYGFTTLVEKEWHRLLTSVQGVGAKASLAIIGALGPEGVSRAIALGDATAIKRAPGVGPKLAARIVNELKDKAPNVMALGAAAAKTAAPSEEALVAAEVASASAAAPPTPVDPSEEAAASAAAAEADALSALVNLGYPAHDAASAVAAAANAESGADAAGLIKAALKSLATRL
ncbi:MAG: Holliday junction branch migration protein RuvA [Neomegalonema sp.]|nr:Holliday junction branch migration protein RuvA [Neomegalonema sp.]